MVINKWPLRRSVFVGSLIFVLTLSIALSLMTYGTFTRPLYRSYQVRMADILVYVEDQIDTEDLYECTQTNAESQKYLELRDFMDKICDDFSIHYLYICMPVYRDGNYGMYNILSADTTYNRKYNPDGLYLGYITTDEYSDEEVIKMMDIIDNEGITYFKNFSDWGYDYTAAKTLKNSRGEPFGLLCVDIEVEDLERSINTYLILNVSLIILLGLLFTYVFMRWLNRNVTDPIARLKNSVLSFASRSHKNKELTALTYEDPDVHTQNEVEVLSEAVSQMTSDIREYVRDIVEAESQMADMKNQVTNMGTLVYKDALTRVKNKAWYDKVKEGMDQRIEDGKAEFGIVMVDLNGLKSVNDTYGHDHGDEYIFGACRQLCVIYSHSSVFRVGGDEFVVLLENTDYNNRQELLKELKESYNKTSSDMSKEPWERYSAAAGMALFDPGIDHCMDDVFKRADALMYEDKQRIKGARS